MRDTALTFMGAAFIEGWYATGWFSGPSWFHFFWFAVPAAGMGLWVRRRAR